MKEDFLLVQTLELYVLLYMLDFSMKLIIYSIEQSNFFFILSI